jgi:hypothetical protein
VLTSLAVVYLRYGRWGDAIALLELVDHLAPGDPRAIGLLAYAYLEDGQARRCVDAAGRYLATGPPAGLAYTAGLIRARASRPIEGVKSLPLTARAGGVARSTNG